MVTGNEVGDFNADTASSGVDLFKKGLSAGADFVQDSFSAGVGYVSEGLDTAANYICRLALNL